MIRRGRYISALAMILAVASSPAYSQDQWARVEDPEAAQLNVRALIVGVQGELFAGTRGRGVWRSPEGRQWDSFGLDTLTTLTITSLALAPDRTLFAGSSADIFSGGGQGVLRRKFPAGGYDASVWEQVNQGINAPPHLPDLAPLEILALGVTVSGAVHASNRYLTYRSADLGDQWAYFGDGARVFLATADGALWAGLMGHLESGDIIRFHPDGTLDRRYYMPAAHWVYSMAFNPETGEILAGTNTDTFTTTTTDIENLFRFSAQEQAFVPLARVGSYGSHVNAIVFRHGGEIFCGLGRVDHPLGNPPQPILGVFRSTNGGQTWENVSRGLEDRDVRAMVVAPDGTLYAGTAGAGVFRSTWRVPVALSDFAVE